LPLSRAEIKKYRACRESRGISFLGEAARVFQFDDKIHVVDDDFFGQRKNDGRKVQNAGDARVHEQVDNFLLANRAVFADFNPN
jgi:hypothetical protein